MKRSLLVASLFCATVISLAHAATLERFDDGRVVVSALGERLTFRKVDAASVGLTMRADAGCDSKTKGIGETTLARWLDDPKVAECLEREIQDKPKQGYYRAIRFHIKFTHENERVYDQDGAFSILAASSRTNCRSARPSKVNSSSMSGTRRSGAIAPFRLRGVLDGWVLRPFVKKPSHLSFTTRWPLVFGTEERRSLCVWFAIQEDDTHLATYFYGPKTKRSL